MWSVEFLSLGWGEVWLVAFGMAFGAHFGVRVKGPCSMTACVSWVDGDWPETPPPTPWLLLTSDVPKPDSPLMIHLLSPPF